MWCFSAVCVYGPCAVTVVYHVCACVYTCSCMFTFFRTFRCRYRGCWDMLFMLMFFWLSLLTMMVLFLFSCVDLGVAAAVLWWVLTAIFLKRDWKVHFLVGSGPPLG